MFQLRGVGRQLLLELLQLQGLGRQLFLELLQLQALVDGGSDGQRRWWLRRHLW